MTGFFLSFLCRLYVGYMSSKGRNQQRFGTLMFLSLSYQRLYYAWVSQSAGVAEVIEFIGSDFT